MTTLPAAIAVLGWLSSAALAVVLARGRRAALAHAAHLARVAHELRGPLQAAGFVLHSVRRQTQDETAIRALAALEVELGRVALATGDLQGEPGTVTAATCDLTALVEDLAPGWATLADAHGRRLRVTTPARSAPLVVPAARLRLAQALGNLVANAVEHGRGDVRVLLHEGRNGTVQLEVCDDGPGLPAPVAALVARPGTARSARGHGLAIADAIATGAGGRLAAAPAASGARLRLTLPGVAVAAAGGGAPAGPTAPLAS